MATFLVAIHIASAVGLAIFGLMGYLTLALYWRHRQDLGEIPPLREDQLPVVTVQLPVYNEREVVKRVISSVAALDYPRDRLEIQILDDSTDETTSLSAECVEYYRLLGFDISLLHRENRNGFKAGALQDALAISRGEYIAFFDADFIPPGDFLRRTIPYLCRDEHLGAVQARWTHLNASQCALTAAQAIALDKHFAIEQLVRNRARLFPKFNGAAGVWRKQSIIDAGGWQEDTVCEDLCLSIRAVLKGWRLHYANQIEAPAELPAGILAYKSQQARWAMGSTQCLRKYWSPILKAAEQSPVARMYALLTMSAYFTHLFFLLILLVQVPLLLIGQTFPGWFFFFSIAGIGQPLLFILAEQSLHRNWPARLRHFPTLLLIAMGIAPSSAWAVLRGLSTNTFTFDRTPKGMKNPYRQRPGRIILVELALMIYSATGVILALWSGSYGALLLLSVATLSFGYVLWLSLAELLND